MSVAAGAGDLGAHHAVTRVGYLGHAVGLDRLEEAGPAGARLELLAGAEQLQAASRARVNAGVVVVPELAGAGPLGPLLAQDAVLLGREAPAPLRVALD